MRICNNLKGRCGHRPLRTTTENQQISRADRVVRPYKWPFKIVWVRRKIAAFPVLCRGGPMWALAPTKDITRFHDFGGRTESSAPTEGFENHACPAKIAAFSVPRRRGRCLHRPPESTRFMTVFRRKRVGFPFSTVGADDPVRPRKMSVFTEIQCEFVLFLRFSP